MAFWIMKLVMMDLSITMIRKIKKCTIIFDDGTEEMYDYLDVKISKRLNNDTDRNTADGSSSSV